MVEREDKHCPRCNAAFCCMPGAIDQCQCAPVELTPEQREHLSFRYSGCLCAACLLEVRNDFDPGSLTTPLQPVPDH